MGLAVINNGLVHGTITGLGPFNIISYHNYGVRSKPTKSAVAFLRMDLKQRSTWYRTIVRIGTRTEYYYVESLVRITLTGQKVLRTFSVFIISNVLRT